MDFSRSLMFQSTESVLGRSFCLRMRADAMSRVIRTLGVRERSLGRAIEQIGPYEMNDELEDDAYIPDALDHFCKCVIIYSSRNLTTESDRLNAGSGVPERFGVTRKWIRGKTTLPLHNFFGLPSWCSLPKVLIGLALKTSLLLLESISCIGHPLERQAEYPRWTLLGGKAI